MCLDLVLRNTTDTIFTTNQVKVEIGLKFDDKIEYIPLGIFNISDVKKDDFTTKFTCYDNMFKFDTAYFSKLGDIPTLTQVVNELASITGIQFIGSLPSYTVKKLEGFTCREILSYVASLCGGNAIITRDGKFTIIYPTDVNRDIGEGVFDLKRDEVKYKIGKVTCQIKEKETISKGSLGTDSMELQFENPWVTDSILADIYNRLNGFSYLGYTMKWQGDLSLDVGDIITHIDTKGVNRKLPILNRKLSYDGGLDSELSAKGETKNSNSFNSNGSMKNKVDRVVTEVALINEAFINYAKINDADITNLKAETAKIHNLEVETANINTLLAGNIGSGSIQTIHLTGKNVVIDNAVIKDGMIDTVNANKINTGTLDTNKVTVQGPSGNLLIKDNTIQIKDSTRVRVQIGKDASNDYNMYVWDSSGKLMFDATGLKADGIKSKIIRDDMVSDNANINGSKLNISSLITEVNKDNTQTLKASKIAFDSTGQSLEVSFNSLKSNVDNMEIGGRNFIKDSDFLVEATSSNGAQTKSVALVSGLNLTETFLGKTVTFSYFVNCPGSRLHNESQGALGNRFGIHGAVTWGDSTGKLSNKGGIYPFAERLTGEYENTRVIMSYTFTPPSGYDTVVSFSFSCQVYARPAEGNDSIWKLGQPKLEIGTKATDFTVAPEDTDSKIQANTTSITAVQGKIEGLIKESTITKGDVTTLKDNYTSIKATVDGINSTVAGHTTSIGNLGGKVTEVETKQATLEQNLNGFKTTVSNTYSTKAELDSAKTDAINSANNSTDNKLKNYSTTTAMNTAISQSASDITSTVSNTYATKTELGKTTTRVESVEQKVTATAITTTISSSINAGTNSISTTQFIMDKSGLTIKNGAIKIQNKAGNTVLTADTDGNLLVQNSLTVGGNTNGNIQLKNASNANIFSASKNGVIIKDGTMQVTTGTINWGSIGEYPEGVTKDMTVYAYGLNLSQREMYGSQEYIKRGEYFNNQMRLIEDNRGNADGTYHETKVTAKEIVTPRLYFNIDRAWAFKAIGAGGSTMLALKSEIDSKTFFICDATETNGVRIFTSSTGANLSVDGSIYVTKVRGKDNDDRIGLGSGNCRIDTTSGTLRLYTSAPGKDNGINIDTDGGVSIKSNNVIKHAFNANGTKTGGSMEIEGTVYGMSPTDSPQTLIEYIEFDVEIDGVKEIYLDSIYKKMISKYAVVSTNPDIVVIEKLEGSFKVIGTGTTDFIIKGHRKGADDYFRIMGGIEHGVTEEQAV